jgi:hypothetical protein
MTMGDREGLIARIRQVRRLAVIRDRPRGPASDSQAERFHALEERMAHLEQLVEGLQDSVHRESERYSKLIADLQDQVQPGAMGAALAKEARNRGL